MHVQSGAAGRLDLLLFLPRKMPGQLV